MINTIPVTDKQTNNLELLNYCLDENWIEVNYTDAKFCRFKFTVINSGLEIQDENLFALNKGKYKFNPGKLFQSYTGLSEDQIDTFFTDYHIDVAPSIVRMKIEFLNGSYDFMNSYDFPDLKFHNGRFSAIPADGSEMIRSLSYNTVLPLAYRYSNNPVIFKYRDREISYDKTVVSSENNIFQMLFFQKYHYADASKLPIGFSSGFSSGFATAEAILNANPLYRYKEGFTNLITSDYILRGINFPLQRNSLNIIWLDDNNIFRGTTFCGNEITNREVVNMINEYSVDFTQRKAGSLKTKKIKVNTGWKLKSEIPVIDEILVAKRIWIFTDDISAKRESYCITDKLELQNETKELIEFTLEFVINE